MSRDWPKGAALRHWLVAIAERNPDQALLLLEQYIQEYPDGENRLSEQDEVKIRQALGDAQMRKKQLLLEQTAGVMPNVSTTQG